MSIYFDIHGNILLEDELVSLEESYEHGGNIVKMSKASKDGECFISWDKATQMNLKEKIRKFCH
jgi:alpha-glucosidase